MMDTLAFLGRFGYQDADALARSRTVAWIYMLAGRVERLLELESAAIKAASNKRGP